MTRAAGFRRKDHRLQRCSVGENPIERIQSQLVKPVFVVDGDLSRDAAYRRSRGIERDRAIQVDAVEIQVQIGHPYPILAVDCEASYGSDIALGGARGRGISTLSRAGESGEHAIGVNLADQAGLRLRDVEIAVVVEGQRPGIEEPGIA